MYEISVLIKSDTQHNQNTVLFLSLTVPLKCLGEDFPLALSENSPGS